MGQSPIAEGDRGLRTTVTIATVILGFTALKSAQSVFEPLAFAAFTVALVWPMQRWLQMRMPTLIALALTMLAVVGVVLLLSATIVWGFGNVARWFINEAPRLQSLYAEMAEWLEGHGILIASFISDNLNTAWVIRLLQEFASRLNTILSFSVITFVYALLLLLGVDDAGAKLEALDDKLTGRRLAQAAADTSRNLQKYMWVRTIMSVLTGLLVWALVRLAGLDLAPEWGVIAFTLNYIPFIGPFIATLFPTVFAIAQFETLQMAIVIFLCLNLIQFVVGSYLEPRIAGKTLSISPFVVLFTVFFWTYLWGLGGAFIGIPIVVGIFAIFNQFPSSRWLSVILSGPEEP
jgi:AI-2 transport protein TqsA